MITFMGGDIFAPAAPVQAIAHGCNCRGVMGAGVALQMRSRYPQMYDFYRRKCKSIDPYRPGDVLLWKTPANSGLPWVFNLMTQLDYGVHKATLPAVEICLAKMHSIADRVGVTSIAMPRIGAGLGGLPWQKVRSCVQKEFKDWTGTLYVFEHYVVEEQSLREV